MTTRDLYPTFILLIFSIFWACPGHLKAAVFVGQIDDFQSGTTQGWVSGALNPHPPTVLLNGGPGGAGDNALELTADGSLSGGKLVEFNTAQWSGDYLTAGVTGIRMNVNYSGSTTLSLRLAFDGPGGRYASITPATISSGSGWQSVTFSLLPGAFSSAGGTDFALTMGAASTLRILHSTVAGSWTGDNVVGTLDVDNITAVPEAQSYGTVCALTCALLVLRRRILPLRKS